MSVVAEHAAVRYEPVGQDVEQGAHMVSVVAVQAATKYVPAGHTEQA